MRRPAPQEIEMIITVLMDKLPESCRECILHRAVVQKNAALGLGIAYRCQIKDAAVGEEWKDSYPAMTDKRAADCPVKVKPRRLQVALKTENETVTEAVFRGQMLGWNACLDEIERHDKPAQKRITKTKDPFERTRAAVYATGNKWAIENFEATH